MSRRIRSVKDCIQKIMHLLYSRDQQLDREEFCVALTALSLFSLSLYGLAYWLISNVDPDSFVNYTHSFSYCMIIFFTSFHLVLMTINIVQRRLASIDCHPLYICGLFVPYLKVLLLALLLAPHGREREI